MYYVGTRQFPSLYEAIAYLSANPAPGLQVTNEPVGDTSGGMLTGSDTSNRTYTYVRESSDLTGGSSRDIWNATNLKTVTGHSGLTDLFNSRKEYQQIFGSADNFISYMDQMYDLQQANPELYNWWETDTAEQFADANGYPPEAAYDGLEAAAQREFDREYLDYQIETREQQFINMSQSGDYQNLVNQFGLDAIIRNDDGDVFAFNGGFPVEIYEVDDHLGIEDYAKMAAAIGLGIWAGPALSGMLTSAGMGATTAGIVSSGLTSAASQLITNGEINPSQLLQSVATAGLTSALSNVIAPAIAENFPDIANLASTGNEAFDNVLNTMALDIARQGVMNGEVDLAQVVQSGMFTAAGELLEWFVDNQAISAEEQAEWEARIAAQTAQQQEELMGIIETQFGEGAFADALNQMDTEIALAASQALSEMFADSGVSYTQDESGAFVEETTVDPDEDVVTDTDTTVDSGPATIINPFEGDTLINGVYYDENGVPVGVSPDATADQLFDQFASPDLAYADTVGGNQAYAIPDDAMAIMVAEAGSPQALADMMIDRGFLLGQTSSGTYILIGGGNITGGFHESLDQNSLLDLSPPTDAQPFNFLNDPALTPTDTSDVSEEVRDLLTNPETQPPRPETTFDWDPTDIDPIERDEVVDIAADDTTTDPEDVLADTTDTLENDAAQAEADAAAQAAADAAAQAAADAAAQAEADAAAQAAADAAAPGITDEMFQDVVDQVRADNQVETQEIIDAINALGIADLPTLAQIEEAFPELNDVSLEEIGSTVSTLLSEAGLLTTEQFTEAMTGVLTPDQLDTALANLPYGTTQDFVKALANAGFATPSDIVTALSESGLATPQDIADALSESGLATPQDIADAFDAAGLATPQDIVDAIAEADLATPEDITTALSEFNFTEEQLAQIVNAMPQGVTKQNVRNILNQILDRELAGVATGASLDEAATNIIEAIGGLDFATDEDVRTALAEFNFSEDQLAQITEAIPQGITKQNLRNILNQILDRELADVATGTSLDEAASNIIEAIGGLDAASPEDIKTILSEYGFTDEQLEQIAGAVTIPASATVEDVQNIIDNLPAGLTAEQVATELSGQFTGLTEGIAGVQSGVEALAEQLGLSTDGLIAAITGLGTTTGEDLTDLQTNILAGLGTLSEDLGVDISDVVTSVTGLEEGIAEGIEGLGEQLTGLGEGITGVEEAVSGVTTAVNQGIEDLATSLGVQTDDIVGAIGTLGSGLGGELTELETSVLTGLTTLANNIGVDVGTVVDSIGGLGTGIGENIQGLSDALTQQLGEGFGGLGTQLGEGFGQLGEQLGLATLGLFGIGLTQPTAQQIAAAQDKFEFKPFEEQMKPRQVQQVVQARRTQQQPSALQQINQFIDRQSNVPRQGMLLPQDPNRNIS